MKLFPSGEKYASAAFPKFGIRDMGSSFDTFLSEGDGVTN
jgi:hypothetical protein